MAGQEGVIKFELQFEERPPLSSTAIRELNAWREICVQTELIGQNPERYAGYGFGNISVRQTAGEPPFIITSSQTGHIRPLTAAHYAVVSACFPAENRVVAYGPLRPSSESMTHGVLYQLDETINCVIHAHSPHIWQHAEELGLPLTAADVLYGTPEMAQEVQRLFRETAVRQHGLFAMGGHEDGIVAFGPTAAAAGTIIITALARALAG